MQLLNQRSIPAPGKIAFGNYEDAPRLRHFMAALSRNTRIILGTILTFLWQVRFEMLSHDSYRLSI